MNKALDSLLADTQTKSQADTQAGTFVDTQPKGETESQTDTLASPEAYLRTQGAARDRLEDTHKRQTYWLTEDEIAMLQELADRTGARKYEIVGTAIQALHQKIIERR